jgi:hypothetical protein
VGGDEGVPVSGSRIVNNRHGRKRHGAILIYARVSR